MKLDKKQVPMLVLLAILVVGCVGYVSFRIVAPAQRPSHPADSAKATKSADDPGQATRDGEADATVTPASHIVGVFPNLAAVPARRDPFIAQKLPAGDVAIETAKSAKYMPKAALQIRNTASRVPPIDMAAFNPFGKVRNTQAAPIIATGLDTKGPEQDFELTGVIEGDSNVVIIRVGKTERHVVREGQTIDGRYQVKSVTGDGAVLVCGNQRILVKLGGNKNAK